MRFERGDPVVINTGSVFMSMVYLGETQDLQGLTWIICQDPVSHYMHMRPLTVFTPQKKLPPMSKDSPR